MIRVFVLSQYKRCGIIAFMRYESTVLLEVVTVSEAAALWNRATSTIRLAADKGYIDARYCGTTQLISVASLIAHYGDPKTPVNALLAKL